MSGDQNRNRVLEIQRRFSEKVEIIINEGKTDERVEIVTDLPEPSFSEWSFEVSKNNSRGNILIRKCQYGESRSKIKEKLPSSEIWSILCDCNSSGEFSPCVHKKAIANKELNCIVGWDDVLQKYSDNINNLENAILKHIDSLPQKMITLYTKLSGSEKNSREEGKEITLEIKSLGFATNIELINLVIYYALNKNIHPNENIPIDLLSIPQYIKSPKFLNFVSIKNIIDLTSNQSNRLNILRLKIEEYENYVQENNSKEYKAMKEVGLKFSNIGIDKNLYYQ